MFSVSVVCLFPYHVRDDYVMYIVAMQLYFSGLQTAAVSTGLAIIGSLPQLRVRVTEKPKQHRRDDPRLTESRNTRPEQLLVMPTELLTY